MFKWISPLVPFADWVLASMCENHFGICELSTPALKTSHPSQGKKAKDTVKPWLPRLCYFHELFTLNNHKWFRVSYNSNWSDQIMYKWHSEVPLCNFPRYQRNLAFNFDMAILCHVLKTVFFFQCTTILYICIVSLNLYVYLYGASR